MKAYVYRNYGSPDVLRLEEVPIPVPGPGQVLVRVRAAGVNPLDWHLLRGKPYLVRLVAGVARPKETGLGADLAGVVEAVGAGVTRFKPGGAVFGCAKPYGAFAEYALAPESNLALKPASIGFDQAAAVPVAALTALQALRHKEYLGRGHRVLVNGAAGGVGTFAVQIAQLFGAQVAAVCSGHNEPLVRALGAERVFDYEREDFARAGELYDVVVDCVGNRSFKDCLRVLAPGGVCVIVGGASGDWLGPVARLLEGAVRARVLKQRFAGMLAKVTEPDLGFLREWLASGSLVAVLDRSYPLAEVPAAIRYLETGHARGKVVIQVD